MESLRMMGWGLVVAENSSVVAVVVAGVPGQLHCNIYIYAN